MTLTTMMSPSARRSLMRAEDEPITLKKKACHPLCRRQSVMIERETRCLLIWLTSFECSRNETQLRKWGQIRILLQRQREQILADCKAEIEKHEFQADYDRRSQKLNEMIESQKEEILSWSSRRRTTSTRSTTSSWTVFEAKLGSSWSSWEKPRWNGRIEAISRLHIRHNCKKKIALRSRHYPWTHWQDTGITEWFPRYQSTSVFLTEC